MPPGVLSARASAAPSSNSSRTEEALALIRGFSLGVTLVDLPRRWGLPGGDTLYLQPAMLRIERLRK